MKICLAILVLTLMVSSALAQGIEITPLIQAGMLDIAFGGVTLKSKTILGGMSSLFHFGGGVRINQQFGIMLGVKAAKGLGLSNESLEDPYVSYYAIGIVPISFTALWFPKPEERMKKPFVFISFSWLHTALDDHVEPDALTDNFPRSSLGIGAGYTLYAITPHIQFEFVPAWGAITYTLGVETGGIFDW